MKLIKISDSRMLFFEGENFLQMVMRKQVSAKNNKDTEIILVPVIQVTKPVIIEFEGKQYYEIDVFNLISEVDNNVEDKKAILKTKCTFIFEHEDSISKTIFFKEIVEFADQFTVEHFFSYLNIVKEKLAKLDFEFAKKVNHYQYLFLKLGTKYRPFPNIDLNTLFKVKFEIKNQKKNENSQFEDFLFETPLPNFLIELFDLHLNFMFNNIEIDYNRSIKNQYKILYQKEFVSRGEIELSELKYLKELNLRSSEIIDNLNFLKYCPNLKKISIWSESDFIYELDSISKIVNLEELSLYTLKITNYDFISNIKKLKKLIISGKIYDYNFLSELTDIEKISISSPENLSKNHPIFSLKNCIELRLNTTIIIEDFSAFDNLTRLKSLIMPFVTLDEISFIKKMKLEELIIKKDNLNITDIDWLEMNIGKLTLI